MSPGRTSRDRFREERRRILRRAAVYTYGFLAAALVVAAAGAALVAWILSFAGLPFRETWLVLIVVLLGVPLIGRAIADRRARFDPPPDETDRAAGDDAGERDTNVHSDGNGVEDRWRKTRR